MFNDVYKDKIVLVTGHTGFKGSWLSIWLNMMGAKVVGYSLDPYSPKGNFNACHLQDKLFADIRADVRDYEKLNDIFLKYKPEIVFHLAAQALVKTAYENPKETYDTNIMGSLNILEVSRHHDFVKQIIMITSDKCYENIEQIWGYKETDRMGGYDPYSASKGCAELMISSYRNSYYNPHDFHIHGKAIANVRAGNVIGGGDWSDNRLIPDCIRFIEANKNIEIRNPIATRPWEHVLEPLSGYLRVGQKLIEDPVTYATSFNFGPDISANKTVLEVVNRLVAYYGKGKVIDASDPNAVHENTLLNLDVTKAYVMLGWRAEWGLQEALEKTVDWYKSALNNEDMYDLCVKQILEHGESIIK
ncbi:CDP-glucose 4,6-dehydratase [Gilliamella sp. wkB108]|uniref:CDP-glucose 4,6-dehydratase n=1 Tax=Gilliamella sp. wkB108 TaxID=3120256 RepID=UPI00080E4A64|nr:CDP-glucose 4,6-dehydratase [Gilliamella apicola]OCG26848.1 CDP-glucose 4,6-dehydratase [Gilliamella apicola]